MWIAFDSIDYGFELCKTEEEARKVVQQRLERQLDEDDEWDPGMENAIGYAKVVQTTKEKVVDSPPGRDDSVSTFELVPVD